MLIRTSRWHRARSAVLVTAVLALGAAGCGSSSSTTASPPATTQSTSTQTAATTSTTGGAGIAKRTIGYVDIFPSGGIQVRWYTLFKKATDWLHWKVINTDAQGVPATANNQALTLLNQDNLDALVVSGVDTAPMRPAINLAHQKHIPVVFLGSPVSDPKAWDGVFTEDESAMARTLAKYVIAQANGASQQNAVVYNTELIAGQLRYSAYKQAIAGSSVKLVGAQTVQIANSTAGTQSVTSGFLNSNPNLNSLTVVYDNFLPPAVSAIEQAHKTNVSLYSYYADRDNLPILLKPGSPLKGLVDGEVDKLSLILVDQLVAYFEKHTPIDTSHLPTFQYKVFTKANAPKYSSSYITPWPTDTWLQQYTQKWQAEYGNPQ